MVDGYQFNADYQRALKAAGFRVLFLDDYGHATHYSADLVLNQNAYANEKMYAARESYTRLLLGTDYCLLRREFSSWRGWKREIAPIGTKILVTMGGSDPENFTTDVVEALCHLGEHRGDDRSGKQQSALRQPGTADVAVRNQISTAEQCGEHARIDGVGRSGNRRGGYDLLGNVSASVAHGAD